MSDDKKTDPSKQTNDIEQKPEYVVLREKASRMPIEECKKLCKATLIMEECWKPISKLKFVSDSAESKSIAFDRFAGKVTKSTWIDSWKLVNSLDDDTFQNLLAEGNDKSKVDTKSDAKVDVKDNKSKLSTEYTARLKGIESFNKAIGSKWALDPSVTHIDKFKLQVRNLQDKILSHIDLIGEKEEFGYLYFKKCFHSNAREDFENYLKVNHPEVSYREKMEKAILYLCMETDPSNLNEKFQNSLDRITSRRHRFVGQVSRAYSSLQKLFPGKKMAEWEKILHVKKMLRNVPNGTDLLLEIDRAMVLKNFETLREMIRFVTKVEERYRTLNKDTKKKHGNGLDSAASQFGRKDCTYWKKYGNCRYGKKCKFKHDPASKGRKPDSNQVPICKAFRFGHCRRGKDCRYRHVKPDEEKKHDKLDDKNLGTSSGNVETDDKTSGDPNAKSHMSSGATSLRTEVNSSDALENERIDKELKQLDNESDLDASLESNTLMLQPYQTNPSLRDRHVVTCYVEGRHEPMAISALIDNGSQPTIVSSKLYLHMRKNKVKMKVISMNGSVVGVNKATNPILCAIEFDARLRVDKNNRGYVSIRIHAIVLRNAASFDLILGIDMQNYYKIYTMPDPNSNNRKVYIDNIPLVHSYCNDPTTSSYAIKNCIDQKTSLISVSNECSTTTAGVELFNERLNSNQIKQERNDLLDSPEDLHDAADTRMLDGFQMQDCFELDYRTEVQNERSMNLGSNQQHKSVDKDVQATLAEKTVENDRLRAEIETLKRANKDLENQKHTVDSNLARDFLRMREENQKIKDQLANHELDKTKQHDALNKCMDVLNSQALQLEDQKHKTSAAESKARAAVISKQQTRKMVSKVTLNVTGAIKAHNNKASTQITITTHKNENDHELELQQDSIDGTNTKSNQVQDNNLLARPNSELINSIECQCYTKSGSRSDQDSSQVRDTWKSWRDRRESRWRVRR